MTRLPAIVQRALTCLLVGTVYGFPLLVAGVAGSPLPEVQIGHQPERAAIYLPAQEPEAADDDVAPPEPASAGDAEAAPAPPVAAAIRPPPEPAASEPPPPEPSEQAAHESEPIRLVLPRPTIGANPAPMIGEGELAVISSRVKARRSGGEATQPRRDRCEPETEAIAEVGRLHWTVERDLLSGYVRDLEAARSLAWVGWHRDEAGEVDGFVVRRIRCGSTLYAAGLRNGDVIHTVNGRPIRSLTDALITLTKIRKREVIRLNVTREGERRRHRYTLT